MCAAAAQREQHDVRRKQLVSLYPLHPAPFGQLSPFTFLPQILPQPFPCWRSRCQTLKSKASSCFHYFMALWALTSCFPFPSPPPPGKERPSPLDLGIHPCVTVQIPLFIHLFYLFEGTRYRPAWFPWGVAWAPGAALRAPGLRAQALLAARDPFMALSAVNLSALQDAITSFFICSSFSSDNVPLRRNSNLLPISCKMWLKFPRYDCCFTYTHLETN